jgi:hypothetical protein
VPGPHDDAVREQFRIQAQTFDDRGFATANLDWITGQLAPAAGGAIGISHVWAAVTAAPRS